MHLSIKEVLEVWFLFGRGLVMFLMPLLFSLLLFGSLDDWFHTDL